jgi:hypothetical protein
MIWKYGEVPYIAFFYELGLSAVHCVVWYCTSPFDHSGVSLLRSSQGITARILQGCHCFFGFGGRYGSLKFSGVSALQIDFVVIW